MNTAMLSTINMDVTMMFMTWQHLFRDSMLTFDMLIYYMLKYPLKCALHVPTSVDISTANDDRTMLELLKYITWG